MLRHMLPKLTTAVATTVVSLFLGVAKTTPALANSITLNTDAQYFIGGGLIDGDPMTSPGGTITSLVTTTNGGTIDFSGDAFATAVNSNGITAVQANGILVSGGSQIHELRAEAIFSEEFTNNSGITQSYTYDFFVPAPSLRIADFVFGPDATISYNMAINVIANSTSTPLWNSSAILQGGRPGFTLTELGTDLGGTFVCFDTGCDPSNPGAIFGYDFNPFSDILSLGTFANGESFTLEVLVEVSVSTLPFELGGFATIGDPGNVSGEGFGGTITSQPVPEPLTILGVGTAVGFGTFFKRELAKKKKGKNRDSA